MLQLPGEQNTVCTKVFQGLAGVLFSMAARSWYCEAFLLVFIFPPQRVQKLLESPTGTEYTVGPLKRPTPLTMILKDFSKAMENKRREYLPHPPQNMTLYFIFDKLDMPEYTSWFRLHLMSHN